MADNGSTDGAPEEALEHYPNVRLLRTGANLGYGTAVNRAVDEYLKDEAAAPYSDFFIVANPDVQWGPRSIDILLEAAGALAAGRFAGTADPRPRRRGVPVGAPSAQPDPGRHARGRRPAVAIQPVDGGLPAGQARAQRTSCRMAVGIVSVAAAGPRSMRWRGSTSAISCIWRTSTSGIALAARAGRTCTCRAAEILHDKGHATGRDPARNLAAHHDKYLHFPGGPLSALVAGAAAVDDQGRPCRACRPGGSQIPA